MNKLPAEILHSIFILLPIVQKQELMLVCRQWKETISTRSLYHTVNCDNKVSFERFIDLTLETPSIGVQVEHLDLNIEHITDDNTLQLVRLFPNLRTVRFQDVCMSRELPSMRRRVNTITFPQKIETLKEFHFCYLLRSMVNEKACAHLQTLELHFNRFKISIFRLFKSLPVLKRLTLTGWVFTLEDMEEIHADIPSLEYLSLGCIKPSTLKVPLTAVEPAAAMTSLVLEPTGVGFDAHIRQLRYIIHKYPQLRQLRCIFGMDDFDFTIKTPISMSTYYYISSFLTLMNSLNPHPSLIDTETHNINNAVLSQLDDSVCQIKRLRMTVTRRSDIDSLIQSIQSKHIEQLVILTNEPSYYIDLNSMKNLEILYIGYTDIGTLLPKEESDYNKTIDVIPFFESFPETVHCITLSGIRLEFKTRKRRAFPIRKLILFDIDSCLVQQLLSSKCFPWLTSLTIDSKFDEDDILFLEHYHLSLLNLKVYTVPESVTEVRRGARGEILEEVESTAKYRKKYGYNIVVKTMNNAALHYYSFPDYKTETVVPTFEMYMRPIPESKLKDNRCLSIVCGSVKKLFINNKNLYPFC